MTPMNMLVAKKASTSYDTDAQAVINAIQLSDTLNTTQKNAINARIVAMKARSTWTKRKAYYGFVGGSAAAHKWNWKDPRDLDAAFRLTFSGGWTHSANGALPNGSTGYADTHLVPSTVLTLYSTSLGFYSRTDQADGDFIDMAALDSGGPSFGLSAKRNGVGIQTDQYDANTGSGRLEFANTNSQGWYMGARIASNNIALYKNGSQVASSSAGTSPVLVVYSVYLAARDLDGSSAVSFSAKQFASAEINDGLTSTEITNEYTDEQAFQTALSRQV